MWSHLLTAVRRCAAALLLLFDGRPTDWYQSSGSTFFLLSGEEKHFASVSRHSDPRRILFEESSECRNLFFSGTESILASGETRSTDIILTKNTIPTVKTRAGSLFIQPRVPSLTTFTCSVTYQIP